MEAKAFGQCTAALVSGTNATTITVVGTKFTSFFIIALTNTVTLTSIIMKWPLQDNEKTVVMPGGDDANITNTVALPVGAQFGAMQSCEVSAGGGDYEVLFFTN